MKHMHIINCLVFPAWAGVILTAMVLGFIALCVPRVGGGDPAHHQKQYLIKECSPRGRG